MYKTSVITDEISQDLRVAMALAREYGLQGVEIRSVNEKNPFQMNGDDVRDILAITRDAGLPICCVSSPMFKCAFDDLVTRKAHMEAFRRMMDTLHLWGARLIRCFNFSNLGDGGKRFPEVADALRPAVAIARDAGVTMVLESEPTVYAANIRMLYDFLSLMDDPAIGAVYDPGNEIGDPDAPPPFPDGYRLLKPMLRHVHVKDILRSREAFLPAKLGEGSVDIECLFQTLRREYDGWASVETHYRVVRMSDESLVHPQGSSFSEGGYEATRQYLDTLRDRYRWMEANASRKYASGSSAAG